MGGKVRLAVSIAIAGVALPRAAFADLTTLVTANNGFTPLEVRSAAANQGTYNTLAPLCANIAAADCGTFAGTPAQFNVFDNVRELVQTANSLESFGGPTTFSLGLDNEQLGFALRWTATEETAAQGAAATEFTNGQMANVTSRITALRFGATGFSITSAGMPASEASALASVYGDQSYAQGAAASGGEQLSPWGAFANVTYGYGDKDQNLSSNEDAFDYDNIEGTFGVDYRFDSGVIVGGVLGVTNSEVDFNSQKSIVDGGFKADGYSIAAFAMYNPGKFYVSGLASYQRMDFSLDRFIKYPSFNPDVAPVFAHTRADPNSDTFAAAVAAGYTFHFGSFSVEPFARAEYQDIQIDQYSERTVNPCQSGTPSASGSCSDLGFAIDAHSQSIDTTDLSTGLRFAYALSTRFGVFIPYARADWHHVPSNNVRNFSADYEPVPAATSADSQFNLQSSKPDENFGVGAVGISGYVRGARQSTVGGRYYGGMSLFLEYRQVFELRDISNEVITGGLRYEF